METVESMGAQLEEAGLDSSAYDLQLLFDSIELNIQLASELNRNRKKQLEDKDKKSSTEEEELLLDEYFDLQLLSSQTEPKPSTLLSVTAEPTIPKPKENESKNASEVQHTLLGASSHNQSIFSIQTEMSKIKDSLQSLMSQFLNPGAKTVMSIMSRYSPMVASLHSVIQFINSEKAKNDHSLNVLLTNLTPKVQILANEMLKLQSLVTQNSETNIFKQDQLHIDTLRCFASLARSQAAAQLVLQRKIDALPKALEEASMATHQATTRIGTQLSEQFLLQQRQWLSSLETNLAKVITQIEDAVQSNTTPKQILTSLKNVLIFDATQPRLKDLVSNSAEYVVAVQLQPPFTIVARNVHSHPVFSRINSLLGYLATNRWIQPDNDLANPLAWIKIANLAKTVVQKNCQLLQQEPVDTRPIECVHEEGRRLFNFWQNGNDLIQKIGALYVVLLKATLRILKTAKAEYEEAQIKQKGAVIEREFEAEVNAFSNMPAPLYDNPLLRKIEEARKSAPSEISPTEGVVYLKSKVRFRGQISPLYELERSFRFNYTEFLFTKKQKAAQIIQNGALSIKNRAQVYQKGMQTRSQIIYPELSATDKFTVLLLVPNGGFPIDPELVSLDGDLSGKIYYRYYIQDKQLIVNIYFKGANPSDQEHLVYRFSKDYKEVPYLDNDVLFDIWYGGRYHKLQDTFELLYEARGLSLSSVEMTDPESFMLVSPHPEKDPEEEEEAEPSFVPLQSAKETDTEPANVDASIVKGFKQNTLTSQHLGYFPPEQEYDSDRKEFVETATVKRFSWTTSGLTTTLTTKLNEHHFYQAVDHGTLNQSRDLSHLFQRIGSVYSILEATCYLFYGEQCFSHPSLEFIHNNVVIKTEFAMVQLVKTFKADGSNLAAELQKSARIMESYLDEMSTVGLQPSFPCLNETLKDLELTFKSWVPGWVNTVDSQERFSLQPIPAELQLPSLPRSTAVTLPLCPQGTEQQQTHILLLQTELKEKTEDLHRATQEVSTLRVEVEIVKAELTSTKGLVQMVTDERNQAQIALMNMENAKDTVQANLTQLAKLYEHSYSQLHQQVTMAISNQHIDQLIALQQVFQQQQEAHQKLQQTRSQHNTANPNALTLLLNQQQSSSSQTEQTTLSKVLREPFKTQL